MLANNCRDVRPSPEKNRHRQKVLNQGLTQKKLQFLLPSSKQILLFNSSIRYNTPPYTEPPAEKTKPDPPKINTGPNNKENCSVQMKTSIMRIENPPSEGAGHADGETAAQTKEKSLKILAQTYNFFTATPSIAKNKAPSTSINFPHYDDRITSLQNILPGEQDGSCGLDSASKQELLARIARLQNLVHDIINGKVAISRQSSQRKIGESPNKRESIKQLGEKFQRREKRSATQTKDLNAKTNKALRYDKGKTKIGNPIVQRQGEDGKQKSFIIKKKGSLKLDGYKPIREEPLQKRKDSFNGEGDQRPVKLKLRVNFMPTIINL